jgi:predicted aconitase
MPGTSFAAGGSAGATFVNSMIGARANREGSPSVVAASICGVTPEYGLHLKENRYGQVIVDLSGLDFAAMTLGDFLALDFYIGRTLVDKTPVIVGVPRQITQDQNPLDLIETGDHVKVDGNRGVVEITKKKKSG